MGGGLRNRAIRPPSERLVGDLVRQVQRFPRTPWTGYSSRTISRYGSYQEPGLEIDSSDLILGQQYAALSVLARDLQTYLKRHPHPDATLLSAVIERVAKEESVLYGSQAFPLYQGLPVAALPTGMAERAASGKPDLSPLAKREIVHEWTCKPGIKLFMEITRRLRRRTTLRADICGAGGLKERVKAGALTKSTLVHSLSVAVLKATGFDPLWAPLVVMFSETLIRKGLDFYCHP